MRALTTPDMWVLLAVAWASIPLALLTYARPFRGARKDDQ